MKMTYTFAGGRAYVRARSYAICNSICAACAWLRARYKPRLTQGAEPITTTQHRTRPRTAARIGTPVGRAMVPSPLGLAMALVGVNHDAAVRHTSFE